MDLLRGAFTFLLSAHHAANTLLHSHGLAADEIPY
jgi:hypothetical protein